MAIPAVDWAKALDAYVAGDREEIVPPGWYPKVEIAKQWGKSDVYTNKILSRMVAVGAAEKRAFTVRLKKSERGKASGYCRKLPHYRLATRKSPKS
jgi:hypothetical protein